MLSRARFLTLLSVISYIATDDIIHKGEHDYSTYYQGSGPLIITSHHNGPLEPAIIPNRHPGCYNGTHCIWEHDCSPQDSSNCGITTVTDSYTKDLATCIYNNVEMFNNNGEFKAHLIINEIRRTKLDPNRQIDEAAQGNSRAEQTWREIHEQWTNMAKDININNCGFAGLLVDIHGQASNDYINLGYRLRTEVINLNDFELNDDYLQDISIKSLIVNNGITVAEGIRGDWSLGTILESYGYDVLPSSKYPTIPSDVTTYFAGATVSTLAIHGSQNSESVTDAIQIEVNRDLRFDEDIRHQFCIDFSRSIVLYLNRWYNMADCMDNGDVVVDRSNIDDGNDGDDGSYVGVLKIGIIGVGLIVILSIGCVIRWCFRKKREISDEKIVEMIVKNYDSFTS